MQEKQSTEITYFFVSHDSHTTLGGRNGFGLRNGVKDGRKIHA
ncbi:hypothetical protein ABH945_000386 [Paraburkholderia sp. GAS333]